MEPFPYKTYSTSGTGGDTFITLLKLYKIAAKEEVHVNHYTIHQNMWDTVRQIYQLMPNISISFTNQRDMDNPRIHSDFDIIEEFVDIEPFPEFNLAHNGKNNYVAYAPSSGKDHETWRHVPEADIPEGSIEVSRETCRNIREAFTIIANAKRFIGYQGLMCFFALSQKIPTTVYIGPDHELDAFFRRVLPEWKEYIENVKRVDVTI